MDKLEIELDFLVLKYIKKNEPTIQKFIEYVNKIAYGFDEDMDEVEDYETKYRNKNMITAGNYDNFVLTVFGEITLKNIKRQKRKEWVQTWVTTGALVVTTITLLFSVIVDF